MASPAFVSVPLQAVAPPSGLVPPTVQNDRFLSASAASADGAALLTSSRAAAALCFGVASIAAGNKLKGRRGRRAATFRRAEEKTSFAGGLIGGESAFGSFDYNFDPLGLAERTPNAVPWFREAELKHGRIAMLAWVGLVVPEFVRIPGPDSCYKATVVEAHKACVGELAYWEGAPLGQVFLLIFILEGLGTIAKVTDGEGLTVENAGDYRLGLNFLPQDEAGVKAMKLKELKNGRLAMLAFGGAITQAVLSGNGFPWLYADRQDSRRGCGIAASVPAARARTSRVAMRAEGDGPYKMSTAVPFLPVSPALEGFIGEEEGFDPMGFSLAIDVRWLREAELKHARVAMLATVGWITTDLGLRVPGEAFQVSTLEAHDAMVNFGNMGQMLAWMGYAEIFGFLALTNMMEGKTNRAPGDFGIRLLYPKDEKSQKEMQLKELRNGRLAMLAYSGIVTTAVLTGGVWPFFATREDQRKQIGFGRGSALCGGFQGTNRGLQGSSASSLKAEEEEAPAAVLEVSKSLPFLPKPQNLAGWVGGEAEFDPLGFSDTFDMKWLRESELKHGRVCMLASVGFAAQQYVTLPGMEPTPNAMDAIYTAPIPAMATLLFLAGYAESASYDGKLTMLDMFDGKDREPGNLSFGTRFLSGKSEEDIKDTQLKELNNGRLAMLAFSGMVHHNLVVKGPLFPLFPEGWTGPAVWEVSGAMTTY